MVNMLQRYDIVKFSQLLIYVHLLGVILLQFLKTVFYQFFELLYTFVLNHSSSLCRHFLEHVNFLRVDLELILCLLGWLLKLFMGVLSSLVYLPIYLIMDSCNSFVVLFKSKQNLNFDFIHLLIWLYSPWQLCI